MKTLFSIKFFDEHVKVFGKSVFIQLLYLAQPKPGEGFHGVSASQSSLIGRLSSHLIFTFCDLHIFKLSIFTSSVFTTEIFPNSSFFALKDPILQSSKKTGTSPPKLIAIGFSIISDRHTSVFRHP